MLEALTVQRYQRVQRMFSVVRTFHMVWVGIPYVGKYLGPFWNEGLTGNVPIKLAAVLAIFNLSAFKKTASEAIKKILFMT